MPKTSLIPKLGVAMLSVLTLALAGCGSASTTSTGASATPTSAAARGSGPVSVLYAGSLVNLMEHDLGPKFDAATGYTFQGQGAGSTALANQIKGKVKQADVFVSASTKADTALEGQANGSWVSWYATFASAPLVLGYNPKSSFAADLASKPWQQVITEPGFRLGRTDPKTDPKGQLAAQALQQVGLTKLTTGTEGVFPETELVGRLQAGQLDAGFFYSSEAKEANIPTIDLKPVNLSATYTVTVLKDAPHQAGAVAFIRYLLSPDGAAILKQHGLTVKTPPTVTGDRAAVPAQLAPSIGGK
ncbi:MAG: extracellular solute-binding protein [Pseudonocardiaceae bacterium]